MTAVIQEHNEHIDQEECPWEDIETLTANGISAVSVLVLLPFFSMNFDRLLQTDVKKLKDAGIQTVAALTMHTRKVQPQESKITIDIYMNFAC
jgi:predicted metal-dependent TIM-barrel fold hydrolase